MHVVMICGSRDFASPQVVRDKVGLLIGLWEPHKDMVTFITGGAAGPDTIANDLLTAAGMNVIVLRPDYNKHGKGAPLFRNVTMVRTADEVIGFWDWKSTGTRHALASAQKRGKAMSVYDGHGTRVEITEELHP